MARPKKTGLDYFPLDVEFDDKVKAVEMLHGNNGLVWVLKIWQAAYKTLTGEVNLSGLFGELHAKNCRITTEEHHNILKTSIDIGLFETIENGFITSNGIKKRISSVSNERSSAITRNQLKDIKDKDIKDKDKYKVKETPHYSANNDRITTEELEKIEMESEQAADEEHKTKKEKVVPEWKEDYSKYEQLCKDAANEILFSEKHKKDIMDLYHKCDLKKSLQKSIMFWTSPDIWEKQKKKKGNINMISTFKNNINYSMIKVEGCNEFDPYRGVVAK